MQTPDEVAADVRAYNTCLARHPEDALVCEGPRQAYEVDPTIVQARLAGGAATAAHGYEQGSAPSSPPRVLTSSGVAALSRRRDAYAQDGAQGHLSSEGLGGDPKHRGAIRPKPQCKLSRMSQLLTMYRNPPTTSNLLRDHARTLGLRREISRKSDLRRQ